MIVKVCGMSDPQKIKLFQNIEADWMGLIFYPKSKRFVESGLNGTKEEIIDAVKTLKCPIVGVFVDEEISKVESYAKEYNLTYIQLHGNESPEYASQVKALGYKIIKAIPVNGAEDVENISSEWNGIADYFLFDYKCEEKGGSGKKFDWSVLSHYRGNVPFLLSGGISENDVDEVLSVKHEKMAGVDLNSKFELSPGVKSLYAIKCFIKELRKKTSR